jgi:hypothetical protein
VTAIADVHPPSDITFAGHDIYVTGRPNFRVVRDALLI